MHSYSTHIPPDPIAIKNNESKEPEGERLRKELTDWLNKNKIVSIYLDTDAHIIQAQIVKLPPNIKPILTIWGSIYVENTEK